MYYLSHTWRVLAETFIEGAIKVHGGKYDYSKVVYKNNATHVLIVCPEHGETFIHNWLTSNNFEFASQHELYLPTSGSSCGFLDNL